MNSGVAARLSARFDVFLDDGRFLFGGPQETRILIEIRHKASKSNCLKLSYLWNIFVQSVLDIFQISYIFTLLSKSNLSNPLVAQFGPEMRPSKAPSEFDTSRSKY